MFTLLNQLITKANLSGITLMVRPTGQGRLSITICTESTDWKAEEPKLKAALSQPLNIEGEVTQLADQIQSDLAQFSESFVQAVISTNVSTVCANTNEAANNAVLTSNNKEVKSDSPEVAEITIGEEVKDPDLF